MDPPILHERKKSLAAEGEAESGYSYGESLVGQLVFQLNRTKIYWNYISEEHRLPAARQYDEVGDIKETHSCSFHQASRTPHGLLTTTFD